MQETSIEDWSKCLAVLDLKAAKRYCRQLDIPDDVLSVSSQLQLSLVDWISHLGVFTDTVVLEVVRTFRPCIEGLAEDLENTDDISVFTFVICDGRYVSCSTRETFFDADLFEDVEELPGYSVTHLMCDVTQLYSRMRYRLAKIQVTPSTETEHA